MSEPDWPPVIGERTPAAEREPNNNFQATIGQTTKEIEAEMDRLGADEWRATTGSGGAYTKSNGLPKHNANPDDPGFVLQWSKDGEQFAVGCDRYSRLRDNLREVYLWVRETRKRGQRPVVTGESEFAAARLPPADEDAIAAPPAPAEPELEEEPHEVLGVAPDAPAPVVKGAYRELVKEAHADQGDRDDLSVQEIQTAREAMLDE